MVTINIEVEETNLEDLIVLGEDKLTPISIEFPCRDGGTLKAKAWIKQLTLKEVKNIDLQNINVLETSLEVLKLALYKKDNVKYTDEELLALPVGVVTAISEQILKLSGIEYDNQLQDF